MRLATERLLLRPLDTEDFVAMRAVLGDAWTMRFYPGPFDDEGVRAWIGRNAERVASDDIGLHAVVLAETGELIGDCGPLRQTLPDGRTEIELGWHIHRGHQSRGYATEAAGAWVGELRAREVPRVISLIRPENAPSRRVAEKLGMHVSERILWSELQWPHDVYRLDLAVPASR